MSKKMKPLSKTMKLAFWLIVTGGGVHVWVPHYGWKPIRWTTLVALADRGLIARSKVLPVDATVKLAHCGSVWAITKDGRAFEEEGSAV